MKPTEDKLEVFSLRVSALVCVDESRASIINH